MKDFEFKKSLGQNFLQDRNVINKITSPSNFENNSLIIEVGPGGGALTKELVKTGNKVIVFEIDERLKESLESIEGNIDIYFCDFLKVNLKEILKKEKYDKLYLVSNLPYYITTPIIEKVINDGIDIDEMILMMQEEVGDRIKATPNSKQYSSLSVYLQYYFDIKLLTKVSKNCFIPKPNVDSIVLRFIKKEIKNRPNNEKIFFELVRDSFKYKRKNLKNNLKGYDLEIIELALKKLGKDLTYRAEQLSIEDFINISNDLK